MAPRSESSTLCQRSSWAREVLVRRRRRLSRKNRTCRTTHDGRDTKGNYADGNPGTSGKAAEKEALDTIEETEDRVIIRDQVKSHVDGGNPNGRLHDGLEKKPDGTYEGYEIKSNSSRNTAQERNDELISYDNPARARLNGEDILITSVRHVRVSD